MVVCGRVTSCQVNDNRVIVFKDDIYIYMDAIGCQVDEERLVMANLGCQFDIT